MRYLTDSRNSPSNDKCAGHPRTVTIYVGRHKGDLSQGQIYRRRISLAVRKGNALLSLRSLNQREKTRPRAGSGRCGLCLQLLSGVVRDQRVNRGLDLPLHYHRKLVVGQADAMIGKAVLRKVISTNLLAAIP
jgi:hypothetical protein